ncbi:MAG: hypothetical protein HC877_07065 [Thioploca sp.]|nr:hypothetical protein [Thioploca sp.]
MAFNVAILSESSQANRAGFSVIVIGQDGKGIELGFKREKNPIGYLLKLKNLLKRKIPVK